MVVLHWKQWRDHVIQRTDPGIIEQVPEKVGDYFYFIREKAYPADVGKPSGQATYSIYCRHAASLMETKHQMTPAQQEKAVEVVLDQMEIPFIPDKFKRSSFIEKLSMNADD